MAYIKALLFLTIVVAAAYCQENARVKKQVILPTVDDGSYWRGKYDIRELSPVLGSLPDGVAVRAAIPAVPAVAPYPYPYVI